MLLGAAASRRLSCSKLEIAIHPNLDTRLASTVEDIEIRDDFDEILRVLVCLHMLFENRLLVHTRAGESRQLHASAAEIELEPKVQVHDVASHAHIKLH